MEESKELNAVIDVIMLAGTILLKSGSEIHRVEDTMIRI
ncbi:TPA: threonine/serine exporter family protein, partial [Streptococcus pneumoniae]|nr:threonine/serine exporter family protein [Streptococcus pneumoniae]